MPYQTLLLCDISKSLTNEVKEFLVRSVLHFFLKDYYIGGRDTLHIVSPVFSALFFGSELMMKKVTLI